MRVAWLLVALTALTSTAHAATVPKAGSASASTLTLPSGPGSIQGLADLGAIDVLSRGNALTAGTRSREHADSCAGTR